MITSLFKSQTLTKQYWYFLLFNSCEEAHLDDDEDRIPEEQLLKYTKPDSPLPPAATAPSTATPVQSLPPQQQQPVHGAAVKAAALTGDTRAPIRREETSTSSQHHGSRPSPSPRPHSGLSTRRSRTPDQLHAEQAWVKGEEGGVLNDFKRWWP